MKSYIVVVDRAERERAVMVVNNAYDKMSACETAINRLPVVEARRVERVRVAALDDMDIVDFDFNKFILG